MLTSFFGSQTSLHTFPQAGRDRSSGQRCPRVTAGKSDTNEKATVVIGRSRLNMKGIFKCQGFWGIGGRDLVSINEPATHCVTRKAQLEPSHHGRPPRGYFIRIDGLAA